MEEVTEKLREFGFTQLVDFEWIDFYETKDVEHEHEGFYIFLARPNGGIIAVDIVHLTSGKFYSKYTEGEFDYHDDKGILAFAKNAISNSLIPTGQTQLF